MTGTGNAITRTPDSAQSEPTIRPAYVLGTMSPPGAVLRVSLSNPAWAASAREAGGPAARRTFHA